MSPPTISGDARAVGGDARRLRQDDWGCVDGDEHVVLVYPGVLADHLGEEVADLGETTFHAVAKIADPDAVDLWWGHADADRVVVETPADRQDVDVVCNRLGLILVQPGQDDVHECR